MLSQDSLDEDNIWIGAMKDMLSQHSLNKGCSIEDPRDMCLCHHVNVTVYYVCVILIQFIHTG